MKSVIPGCLPQIHTGVWACHRCGRIRKHRVESYRGAGDAHLGRRAAGDGGRLYGPGDCAPRANLHCFRCGSAGMHTLSGREGRMPQDSSVYHSYEKTVSAAYWRCEDCDGVQKHGLESYTDPDLGYVGSRATGGAEVGCGEGRLYHPDEEMPSAYVFCAGCNAVRTHILISIPAGAA